MIYSFLSVIVLIIEAFIVRRHTGFSFFLCGAGFTLDIASQYKDNGSNRALV